MRDSDLIRKLIKAGMSYRNFSIVAKCSRGSYGGTCSSFNLREALLLKVEIENHKNHPDYFSVKEGILKMIERWRSALLRHNAQAVKGIEFDIETGKQKNEKV